MLDEKLWMIWWQLSLLKLDGCKSSSSDLMFLKSTKLLLEQTGFEKLKPV